MEVAPGAEEVKLKTEQELAPGFLTLNPGLAHKIPAICMRRN